MGQISKKLRTLEGGRLGFWCPGCEQAHWVAVGEGPGPRWGYNGNPDAPTFTPSVLVRGIYADPPVTRENMDEWKRAPWPQTRVERICHSFIADGRIQFLGDCTHHLAGQTVDLPDLPSHISSEF